MTSAVEPAAERADVRTIVGGGLKLGVLTAVGVALFAFASRGLAGTVETIVQSVLVLVGGALFSYLPAYWLRPRSVDGIAWAALVGLLGALSFTVIDTALLRPLGVYHWTWDQIGGGSGFWYISVWWMGSAFLAWLGAWVCAVRADRGTGVFVMGGQTVAVAVIVFAIVVLTRLAPAHAAVMSLAWTVALMIHVPAAYALAKR